MQAWNINSLLRRLLEGRREGPGWQAPSSCLMWLWMQNPVAQTDSTTHSAMPTGSSTSHAASSRMSRFNATARQTDVLCIVETLFAFFCCVQKLVPSAKIAVFQAILTYKVPMPTFGWWTNFPNPFPLPPLSFFVFFMLSWCFVGKATLRNVMFSELHCSIDR